MYGVVLMMALSGGADVPALNDAAGEHIAKYGDHGQKEYRRGRRCHGCSGGGYCGGGYCGGGYCGGGGWGGCCGGYGYGGYGYGGYYGMPYSGGYYGFYSPYAGSTYYGSTYGTPAYSDSMPANYNYGVPSGQGGSPYYGNTTNAEQLGAPNPNGPAPARILVRLPADASLTVDGSATKSTEGIRAFISPPLQPGKDYQYTLRAEVMRDGKKVERTRDVTVRAGQQSEVTFELPMQGGPSRE
jgi:uncharacterized protein (TIGR03000 family)